MLPRARKAPHLGSELFTSEPTVNPLITYYLGRRLWEVTEPRVSIPEKPDTSSPGQNYFFDEAVAFCAKPVEP